MIGHCLGGDWLLRLLLIEKAAIDIPNDGISLRFKYGPQTIFLFVDRSATFDAISTQLLEVLRERYPRGLANAAMLPETTPIPAAGEEARVVYAAPKNLRDLAAGWKPLNTDNGETPASMRLRENAALAFAIQKGDEIGEAASFHVEIPTFEDEDE
ncbi:uncharacterized protein SPSK_07991 [Sporothrix schenckii 1099-18]|uniref:Uncharacterized protein n=1 Tax=Sporothrix schenckii 1099-18 TaxID=1397361 RepID=A0A0F2MIZ4_SPOSC|nr:uncharacterized protein SPSK_07991 [Sporothrix schenckii 1099-18]KJR89024.1 hypothetical protein SPSK_07991 [Sporothrix schenckii 1099-18]